MSWVTAAQGGSSAPSVPTDLDEITDEEFLRQLWQQAEDFGDRRRIRARMYKLREKRLREMVQNDEENLGALTCSPNEEGDFELKTDQIMTDSGSSTERRSSIEVKMIMKGDSAITDSVTMQNVSLGGVTMRGVGGVRKTASSDEDIINERIKEVSKGRGTRYLQTKNIYDKKSGEESMGSISKTSYSIQSNALAGDSYQSMKHKEVRDSVSPTRGAFDRSRMSGEDSETFFTSDDEIIMKSESANISRKISSEDRSSHRITQSRSDTTVKKESPKKITERKLSKDLTFNSNKRAEKSSPTSPTRRIPGENKTTKKQTPSPRESQVSPTRNEPGRKSPLYTGTRSPNTKKSKLDQIAKQMDESLRNEYKQLDAYINENIDKRDEIIMEEEEEAVDEFGNIVKMIVQTRRNKDGTECTTRRVARSTKIVDKESDIDEILIGNPDHEVLERNVEEKEETDGSKIKIITETRRRPDGIEYTTKNVLRTSKIFDYDHPEDVSYCDNDELLSSEESQETDERGISIRTVTETRRKQDGTEYMTKKVFKTSKVDAVITPSDDDEIFDTQETEEKENDGTVVKTVIEKRRTKDGQEYTHRQIYRSRKVTLSSIDVDKGMPQIDNDDEIIDKKEKQELDENKSKVKVVTETRRRKDGSTYSFDYVLRSFKGTENDINKMPVNAGSSSNIAVSDDDKLLKEDIKEEIQKDGSTVKTITERRRAKNGTEYLRHRIMRIPKLPEPELQVGSLDDEVLEEDVKEKVLDDGTHCRAITERRRSSTTGAQYTLRRMSKVYQHHTQVDEGNDEIIDENVTEEETSNGIVIKTVIRRYERPDGTFYTTHDIQKSYKNPVSITIEGNEEDELVDRSYDERETNDGYVIKTIIETRCRTDGTHYTVERTEKVSKLAGNVQVSFKGKSISVGSPGDTIISCEEHEEPTEDGVITKTILEVRQREDGTRYTNKTTIKSTQLLVPEHETSYVVIKADTKNGEDDFEFFPSLDDEIVYTRKRNDVDEKGNAVTIVIETRKNKNTGELYNLTKRVHTTDVVMTKDGEKIFTNKRRVSSNPKIEEEVDVPYGSVSALKNRFVPVSKKDTSKTSKVAIDRTNTANKKMFFEEAAAKTLTTKVSTPKSATLERNKPKRSSSSSDRKNKEKSDDSSPETIEIPMGSSPIKSKELPITTVNKPLESNFPTKKEISPESSDIDYPKVSSGIPDEKKSPRSRTKDKPSSSFDKPVITKSDSKLKKEISPKKERPQTSQTKSSEYSKPKERSSDSSPEQRSPSTKSPSLKQPVRRSLRSRNETPVKASPDTKPKRVTQSPVPSSPQRGRSPLRSGTSTPREGTPSGRFCCKRSTEPTDQTPVKVKSMPVLRKKPSDDRIITNGEKKYVSKPTKESPGVSDDIPRVLKSVDQDRPTKKPTKIVEPVRKSPTYKYERPSPVTKPQEKRVYPTKSIDNKYPEKEGKVGTKPSTFLEVESKDPIVSLPQTPLTEEMKAYPTSTSSPYIEDVSSEPDLPYEYIHRPSLVREPSELPSPDVYGEVQETEPVIPGNAKESKTKVDKEIKSYEPRETKFKNKLILDKQSDTSEDDSKKTFPRFSSLTKKTSHTPEISHKPYERTQQFEKSLPSKKSPDIKLNGYHKTDEDTVVDNRDKSTKRSQYTTKKDVDAEYIDSQIIPDEVKNEYATCKYAPEIEPRITSTSPIRRPLFEKSVKEVEPTVEPKSTPKFRDTFTDRKEPLVPVVEPTIVPRYIRPLGSDDESDNESKRKVKKDVTKLTSTRLVMNVMSDVKTNEESDIVAPLRDRSMSPFSTSRPLSKTNEESDIVAPLRDRSMSPLSTSRPRSKEGSPSPFMKEGSPSRFVTGRPIDEGPDINKIKRLERSHSNKKIIYEDLEVETFKLPGYLADIEYITDITVLEKLLQKAESYEERRVIRGHIRNLKKTDTNYRTPSSSPAPYKRFVDSTTPSKPSPTSSPLVGRRTLVTAVTITTKSVPSYGRVRDEPEKPRSSYLRGSNEPVRKSSTEETTSRKISSEESWTTRKSSREETIRKSSIEETTKVTSSQESTRRTYRGDSSVTRKLSDEIVKPIRKSSDEKPRIVRRVSKEDSKPSRKSSTDEESKPKKISPIETSYRSRKSSTEEDTILKRKSSTDDDLKPRRKPLADDEMKHKRKPTTEDDLKSKRKPSVEEDFKFTRKSSNDDYLRTVRKTSTDEDLKPKQRPPKEDDHKTKGKSPCDDDFHSKRTIPDDDSKPKRKPSTEEIKTRRNHIEENIYRKSSTEETNKYTRKISGDDKIYIKRSTYDETPTTRKLSSEQPKSSRKIPTEEPKATRKLSSEEPKSTRKLSSEEPKPTRRPYSSATKTTGETTSTTSSYSRITSASKKTDSAEESNKYSRKTSSEKVPSHVKETSPVEVGKKDLLPKERGEPKTPSRFGREAPKDQPTPYISRFNKGKSTTPVEEKKKTKPTPEETFVEPLRHQRNKNGAPAQQQTDMEKIVSPYGVGPTDENGVPLFGLKALKRRTQPTAPSEKEPEDFFIPKEEVEEFVPSDSQGRPLFGINAVRKSPPEKTTFTATQVAKETATMNETCHTATLVTEESHLTKSLVSQAQTFETEVVSATNIADESYPSTDMSSDDSQDAMRNLAERRQRRLKRKIGKRYRTVDSEEEEENLKNLNKSKMGHLSSDDGHSSELDEGPLSDAHVEGETSPALVKAVNESLRRRHTSSSESEAEEELTKNLKDIIKLHESKVVAENAKPDSSPQLKPKKKLRDSFEPTNEPLEPRSHKTWDLETDLSTRSDAVGNIIARHETLTKQEKKLTGILKKTSTSSITTSKLTSSEQDTDDDNDGLRKTSKSKYVEDDDKKLERKTSYTEIKLSSSPKKVLGDATKPLKRTSDKKLLEERISTSTIVENKNISTDKQFTTLKSTSSIVTRTETDETLTNILTSKTRPERETDATKIVKSKVSSKDKGPEKVTAEPVKEDSDETHKYVSQKYIHINKKKRLDSPDRKAGVDKVQDKSPTLFKKSGTEVKPRDKQTLTTTRDTTLIDEKAKRPYGSHIESCEFIKRKNKFDVIDSVSPKKRHISPDRKFLVDNSIKAPEEKAKRKDTPVMTRSPQQVPSSGTLKIIPSSTITKRVRSPARPDSSKDSPSVLIRPRTDDIKPDELSVLKCPALIRKQERIHKSLAEDKKTSGEKNVLQTKAQEEEIVGKKGPRTKYLDKKPENLEPSVKITPKVKSPTYKTERKLEVDTLRDKKEVIKKHDIIKTDYVKGSSKLPDKTSKLKGVIDVTECSEKEFVNTSAKRKPRVSREDRERVKDIKHREDKKQFDESEQKVSKDKGKERKMKPKEKSDTSDTVDESESDNKTTRDIKKLELKNKSADAVSKPRVISKEIEITKDTKKVEKETPETTVPTIKKREFHDAEYDESKLVDTKLKKEKAPESRTRQQVSDKEPVNSTVDSESEDRELKRVGTERLESSIRQSVDSSVKNIVKIFSKKTKGIEESKRPVIEISKKSDEKLPELEKKQPKDTKRPVIEISEKSDEKLPELEKKQPKDTKWPVIEISKKSDEKLPEFEKKKPKDTKRSVIEISEKSDEKLPELEKKQPTDTKRSVIEISEKSDEKLPELEKKQPKDTKRSVIEVSKKSDEKLPELEKKQPKDTKRSVIDICKNLDEKLPEFEKKKPKDTKRPVTEISKKSDEKLPELEKKQPHSKTSIIKPDMSGDLSESTSEDNISYKKKPTKKKSEINIKLVIDTSVTKEPKETDKELTHDNDPEEKTVGLTDATIPESQVRQYDDSSVKRKPRLPREELEFTKPVVDPVGKFDKKEPESKTKSSIDTTFLKKLDSSESEPEDKKLKSISMKPTISQERDLLITDDMEPKAQILKSKDVKKPVSNLKQPVDYSVDKKTRSITEEISKVERRVIDSRTPEKPEEKVLDIEKKPSLDSPFKERQSKFIDEAHKKSYKSVPEDKKPEYSLKKPTDMLQKDKRAVPDSELVKVTETKLTDTSFEKKEKIKVVKQTIDVERSDLLTTTNYEKKVPSPGKGDSSYLTIKREPDGPTVQREDVLGKGVPEVRKHITKTPKDILTKSSDSPLTKETKIPVEKIPEVVDETVRNLKAIKPTADSSSRICSKKDVGSVKSDVPIPNEQGDSLIKKQHKTTDMLTKDVFDKKVPDVALYSRPSEAEPKPVQVYSSTLKRPRKVIGGKSDNLPDSDIETKKILDSSVKRTDKFSQISNESDTSIKKLDTKLTERHKKRLSEFESTVDTEVVEAECFTDKHLQKSDTSHDDSITSESKIMISTKEKSSETMPLEPILSEKNKPDKVPFKKMFTKEQVDSLLSEKPTITTGYIERDIDRKEQEMKSSKKLSDKIISTASAKEREISVEKSEPKDDFVMKPGAEKPDSQFDKPMSEALDSKLKKEQDKKIDKKISKREKVIGTQEELKTPVQSKISPVETEKTVVSGKRRVDSKPKQDIKETVKKKSETLDIEKIDSSREGKPKYQVELKNKEIKKGKMPKHKPLDRESKPSTGDKTDDVGKSKSTKRSSVKKSKDVEVTEVNLVDRISSSPKTEVKNKPSREDYFNRKVSKKEEEIQSDRKKHFKKSTKDEISFVEFPKSITPKNTPESRYSSKSPEPEDITRRLKKLSKHKKSSEENISEMIQTKLTEGRTHSLQSLSASSTTSSVPGYMRPRGDYRKHSTPERDPQEIEDLLLRSYEYTRCTKRVNKSPVTYDYTYSINTNERPAGGGSNYSIYFGPRKSVPASEQPKEIDLLRREVHSRKTSAPEDATIDRTLLGEDIHSSTERIIVKNTDVSSENYGTVLQTQSDVNLGQRSKLEKEESTYNDEEDRTDERRFPKEATKVTYVDDITSRDLYQLDDVLYQQIASPCEKDARKESLISSIEQQYEDTIKALDSAKDLKPEDKSYLNIRKEYLDKVMSSSGMKSSETKEYETHLDNKQHYEDTIRKLSKDVFYKPDTNVAFAGSNLHHTIRIKDDADSLQRDFTSQYANKTNLEKNTLLEHRSRRDFDQEGDENRRHLLSVDVPAHIGKCTDLQEKYKYQVEKNSSKYLKVHDSSSSKQNVESFSSKEYQSEVKTQVPSTVNKYLPDYDYNKVYADKLVKAKKDSSNTFSQSTSNVDHFQTDDRQRYDTEYSTKFLAPSKTYSHRTQTIHSQDPPTFVTFDGRPVTRSPQIVDGYSSDSKKLSSKIGHVDRHVHLATALREDGSRPQVETSPCATVGQEKNTTFVRGTSKDESSNMMSQSNVIIKESRSFLDDQSKVTGITDILSRMGASEAVDHEATVTSDEQARSLLNKFIGAQVLMTGVESMMANASTKQASSQMSMTNNSGNVTVSRELSGESTTRSLKDGKVTEGRSTFSTGPQTITYTTTSSSASPKVEELVIVKGVNINEVTDDFELNQLLDSCEEYEERRRVRLRLKALMAEKKALQKELGGHEKSDFYSSSRRTAGITGSKELHSSEGGSASFNFSRGSTQVTNQKTNFSSSFSTSQNTNLRTSSDSKGVSAFDKFKQLDAGQPKHSTSAKSGPALSGPLFQLSSSLKSSAANIKDVLLTWCQCRTRDYQGVKIENFSTSWNDGLAFCALIHHFYPSSFDFNSLNPKNRRQNFALAFRVAEEKAGVMALLDVDDMVMMQKPDWKSVFTYVQSLYKRLKDE